ncbi:MAG TPA: methionyl-tRNA formyltransferase, partial [archaeon]|nr:methionyl-tRNA formyltransferase [archaeon]
MKIIFWGKGNRGLSCLHALLEKGHNIDLVVGHPEKKGQWYGSVVESARKEGLKTLLPEDPNAPEVERALKARTPDLFILGGYGKILKQNIIEIPKLMTINLHAGKLSKYRGSSPLNWALINGEPSFTLSVIKVDAGVDTGDILAERTFPISPDNTIRDLHKTADQQFPLMLLEVLARIEKGECIPQPQNKDEASYYPLRFPEDGFILWDTCTAEQVHNRVRALTDPYPCAFTFFKGRKVKLLSSELYNFEYYGEPGRVYIKSAKRGLLVCAQDKCLWITEAVFEDSGEPLFEEIKR